MTFPEAYLDLFKDDTRAYLFLATSNRDGAPQGGIVSPILANIYLHFALDLWFQKVVIPHCSGEARLIRYADDFVCAFEKEEVAIRFYQALGERLKKFNLELSAEKTHILPFSPTGPVGNTSFNFLGFEFSLGHRPGWQAARG